MKLSAKYLVDGVENFEYNECKNIKDFKDYLKGKGILNYSIEKVSKKEWDNLKSILGDKENTVLRLVVGM